ncbi:glycosyltransferase [Cellulosimicrobium cellulans]|uniref:glycosyltransferase n=1 Tax=Cellulosimicrobium cellulans TaxID=1710 RepID=UPI001EDB9FA6|nr:glycosyltransferase [Cellulosimicrobium cellulans]UKJ65530.1 glycosyltransferase [Cellulosimicrobium cellulans]
MTATPFSVLLPYYRNDDPAHLRRSFLSVTADQTRTPDEVVLVEDGPTGHELDATVRGLLEGAVVPVQHVRLETNVGLARALEEGLARCRHEIVARQDADDVSRPGRFARQLPLLEQGFDLVGSAIEELDGRRAGEGLVRVPPTTQADIERRARFASPFNHPTVVFRRTAVREAGGYQHLDLLEDYWLFARMIARGARVANVPEPLVLYRVDAGAYRRRGGRRLLRSEIELQRRMHRIGFTTRAQHVRNVVLRGGYRVLGEPVRRALYRSWVRLATRRAPLGPARHANHQAKTRHE